jgi:catechol 2,3-dioxygenase-like lactoylglutathione lyase family enzyme
MAAKVAGPGPEGAPITFAGMSVIANSTEIPRWRGVNHLALITPDMDETVRFYHGVLGARLVATIGNPSFRHYFFEVGPEQTVAFFEYRDVPLDTFAKPAGVPDPRAVQFDHLSLNLADEDALRSLQGRLRDYGCEVTEVVDHQTIHSIYFSDPHGIALEASCWVLDATSHDGDLRDERFFGDPDPVAAVHELIDDGQLAYTPATVLAQDPADIVDPA